SSRRRSSGIPRAAPPPLSRCRRRAGWAEDTPGAFGGAKKSSMRFDVARREVTASEGASRPPKWAIFLIPPVLPAPPYSGGRVHRRRTGRLLVHLHDPRSPARIVGAVAGVGEDFRHGPLDYHALLDHHGYFNLRIPSGPLKSHRSRAALTVKWAYATVAKRRP